MNLKKIILVMALAFLVASSSYSTARRTEGENTINAPINTVWEKILAATIQDRTFIQTTVLLFTLWSAIFLIKGNLGLSPSVIAELSTTKWGYNQNVIRSLSTQSADTRIGFIFLLIALGLQLWNIWRPMRVYDFRVNKVPTIISLILCVVILGISWRISRFMAARIVNQVQKILNAHSSQNGSE